MHRLSPGDASATSDKRVQSAHDVHTLWLRHRQHSAGRAGGISAQRLQGTCTANPHKGMVMGNNRRVGRPTGPHDGMRKRTRLRGPACLTRGRGAQERCRGASAHKRAIPRCVRNARNCAPRGMVVRNNSRCRSGARVLLHPHRGASSTQGPQGVLCSMLALSALSDQAWWGPGVGSARHSEAE